MINLFERLDVASTDFLRSQLFADLKIPTVVIHDDGFLPKEVDSPVKFYCKFTKKNTPLYFDQLKVPEFYRIVATAQSGEVYDLDQKKADIVFIAGDNSRLIKEVRWLNNKGQVSWIDHYNREGRIFAKTYLNNGQEILRKYFDSNGDIVISHYIVAGDIFLNEGNITKHFADLIQFVRYYLKKRNYKLNHIFYNTLNEAMLISLGVDKEGSDTLFWHEKLGDALPGNMIYLNDNQTRTKHVVFENYLDWLEWQDKLPESKNVDFRFLGMIYPHSRGNKLRPEAIIVTNSDQIEHLDEIVRSLPNINFHIAAVTEMSNKLLAFNKYNNVELYPNASPNRIRKLYQACDIYLDINHGNEILDSVRGAFEQNMLIVGFDNTLHNPNFVNSKSVFSVGQVDKMAERISEALEDANNMEKFVDDQRLTAGDTTVEIYRQAIEVLRNE